MSNAARIGTRYAMVRGACVLENGNPCPNCTSPLPCQANSDDIKNYIKGYAFAIDWPRSAKRSYKLALLLMRRKGPSTSVASWRFMRLRRGIMARTAFRAHHRVISSRSRFKFVQRLVAKQKQGK